ncbi:hypothetical protein D043_4686A, partial [Vibrio parahaemolyticus EKP-021]
METTGNQDA